MVGQQIHTLFARLPLPGENILLLEGDGAGLIVDLLVEAAGVADDLAGRGPAPQRGGGGRAVAAGGALPLAGRHPRVLGLDQRPVVAVHLVVQAAGIAQVVT